jgi:flagellar hook-length control protein FliK
MNCPVLCVGADIRGTKKAHGIGGKILVRPLLHLSRSNGRGMCPAIAAFGIFVAPSADMIVVSASAAKSASRPNAPAKANEHSTFSDLLAATNSAEPQKKQSPGDRGAPANEERAIPPHDAKQAAKGEAGHKTAGKKENGKEKKAETDDKGGDPPEPAAHASSEPPATGPMVTQPAPAASVAPQSALPSPADGAVARPASDPIAIGETQFSRADTTASAAPRPSGAPPAAAQAPSSTPVAAAMPRASKETALPQADAPDNAKASAGEPKPAHAAMMAAGLGVTQHAVPATPAAAPRTEPATAKAADTAPIAQAAKDTSDTLSTAVKTAAAGMQPVPDAPKPEAGSAPPAKKTALPSQTPVATGALAAAAPEIKAEVKDSAAPQPAVDKASDNAKPVHAATPDKIAQQPEPQTPPPPPAAPAQPPVVPAQNLLANGLGSIPTPSAPIAAPAATLHIATAHDDAAPDLDGLAVSVAARALSGIKQFEIRLDPPELGRVDVRLSIDASGKTQAHMTADQPQTLTLLQKDAPTLTQALRDAGLDVSQGGLNFSLRGQDRQGNDGNRDAPGRRTNLSVSRVIGAAQSVAAISAGGAAADARLDIHV